MFSTAFDFNKFLYISAAMFNSVCVLLILKEFSVCFYMNMQDVREISSLAFCCQLRPSCISTEDPHLSALFWKLVISLPDPDYIQSETQGRSLRQLTKWLKAKFHRGASHSTNLSSLQVSVSEAQVKNPAWKVAWKFSVSHTVFNKFYVINLCEIYMTNTT